MTLTEKTRAGFANITLRGGRITKWKGEAASCSPQLGSLVLGVSGSALAAALVMVPQAAEAGTCTETSPGSGEFVCAGSVSPATPQTISRPSPVTVTTEPGFGITTTTGTAIAITSYGDLTFTDDNASTIAGVTGGLSATNNGTGEVSVTTNGTVSTTLGTGLRVVAVAGGADMTIESATVLGGQRGIYARHNGSGDLTITSTGLARGTAIDGIYARTAAAGSGLTIEAADTTGGQRGIRARHYGSEVLTVTSTGTARGTLIDGIYARNTAAGTDVTVEAYDTTGGQRGIRARNYGSGDLVVISTGAARGTTLDGIYARNSAIGQSMTVEANDTTGGLRGIYARNNGSGELEIISTGTARGTLATGIYARNQGTTLYLSSNNAIGGIRGIDARNNGSGTLEITSTGTATGTTAEGIYANNRGTDLTIEAADTNGGLRGISALNNGSGALVITSSGNARGTLLDGIYARNEGTDLTIESNNATGLLRGIYARNNGSGALGVTSTGTATGTVLHGIYARNQGTDLTIEAADTTGGQRGIFARNYGSGVLSITSTGTARGTSGEGIFAENTASGIGITISANDAISGTLDAYGAITGGFAGINAVNRGTAAVPAGSTGSTGLTIIANNTTGEQYGIRGINEGSGALSITSNGTATGALGTAIYGRVAGEGTDLLISARDAFGLNRGIDAANFGGGAITIVSTGIASGQIGINAVNGKSATDITITANDTSGALDGINANLQGSGRLTISSAGFADGVNNGILAQSYGSGIDIAAKDTRGARTGIQATNLGTGAMTITSTGTAVGTADTGIRAENGLSATDLTVNAVDVIGPQVGIRAINQGSGALTITATGTITSGEEYGQGVNARASGTSLAINVKDVTAGQYGVYANNAGSGALTITSTGLIDQTTATVDDMPLGRSGISAINGAGGTDLRIDANDVRGVVFGVRTENQGSGDLAIRSTGRIEATGTDAVPSVPLANTGIFAFNNTSGGSVDIAVNDVAGARGGILVNQRGTGAVSVSSTGTVTGNIGIEVRNTAASGPVTIAANTIAAGERGVLVEHLGRGDLTITTTGLVEADTGSSSGIRASNRAVDGGVIIDAADVTGRAVGIYARNYGSGGISVTSSGKLTGFVSAGGATAGTGIIAQNFTSSGGGIMLDVNEVYGGRYGVSAINLGGGAVVVNATGDVTAGRGGIGASNSANGTDLFITATNVMGAQAGIGADNRGNGILSITTSGDVKTTNPTFGYGITAYSAGAGKGVVVDANNVSASLWGIRVRNYGAGDTIITARGDVTGTTRAGITGINAATADNLTITANNTTGERYGIEARNNGTGALSITATGTTRGTSRYGIYGLNSGTSLTISAGETIGGTYGLRARNAGRSALTIRANGDVTGLTRDGIQALNSGTDLVIEATDVTGNLGGIFARNEGSGALKITSTGTARGMIFEGISANNSVNGTDLSVTSVNAIGTIFGISATNAGTGSLSVVATGTTSGTTGVGIDALNRAAGGDLTVTAADTSGGTFGIRALNNGRGALSVTSTGTAIGAGPEGILAYNSAAGTSLTVNANNTSGRNNGIYARNNGSGALSITSTGTAAGRDYRGIAANNSAAGTDLAIVANETRGPLAGISATNNGTGVLRITSTGSAIASAASGVGISAIGGAGSSGLSVTSANASGGLVGIYAAHSGSGVLSVTSTGLASGATSRGISVGTRVGSTADIVVSSQDATGGGDGISVSQAGTGSLTLTSTGLARGTSSRGISVSAGLQAKDVTVNAASASGPVNGIFVGHYGTGSLTVTATGEVTGNAAIVAAGGGTDLRVTAFNTIGTNVGISASSRGGGVTEVVSTGLASATNATADAIQVRNLATGTAMSVTSRDAEGGRDGISATNIGSGALTITSTGTASGTNGNGIFADNSSAGTSLTVVSNNAIGGNIGIYARNNGSGALTVASNDASGGVNGIFARHTGRGALSITSSGAASGNSTAGIYASTSATGTSLTVSAVDTAGGVNGLEARNTGTGALTITSTGKAIGRSGRGIYALNRPTGTSLTVSAVDADGGLNGLDARNTGRGPLMVTSTGNSTGGTGGGVLVINGSNGTDATVRTNNTSGGLAGVLARNSGSGALTITATGTSTGTETLSEGVSARNYARGTALTLTANNTIGGRTGILADNWGSGALTITTTGTTTGTNRIGIDALNRGTSLTIDAGGAVTGGVDGIRARNYGTAGLTIRTSGNVTGGTGAAINAFNSANDTTASMLIEQAAGSTFTGATDGITADNAGGSLTVRALGTLVGSAGSGVNAVNQASATGMTLTVNNASGSLSGIAANNLGSGQAAITLTGTAQGGTGAAIDTLSGAGNLTTITLAAGARALAGASGVAIANNEGNSALIVAPGASISGEVRLGAGNDTATFTGPNALAGITLLDGGADIDALTLNGLVGAFNPAQIANWETITFAAQSNVTATGLTIDNLIVNDSTGRFTTLAAGTLTTSNAQVSLVGASTVNAISACGGALTLGGTTSVGAAGIQGCAAGESITVQDDARIAGNIVGAGGSDVIAVLGNASVAGTIFGGGAGSDNSAAADGTNTITINTTATIGAIEGGIGRDVITLTNGRVTAGVLGGDGNDAITLAGATIAGAIDGGAGDDTITLTSGSAGSVLGGDGNDIVHWNAAAATTSLVAMGAGSDTLNINAAAIGLASTTLDGGVGPAGKFDTLNLNAGWSGDLVGARVTNWDAINVNGGTIRIADAALTTGSLNIGDGGRLNASNNLVLTGNLALVSGGGLLAGNVAGNNTVNVSGNLTNGGVIDLRGPGGQSAAGDRLIIGGNYAGLAGSTLLLDAVLGGSNASDLVVVRGNLTGSSTVVVNNVGGTGGLTSGDGIRLVQVEGASAPGALTLAGGGVDAGAFRYELFAGGIANPGRGDWFLRSRTRDVVVAAMNLARLSQDIGLTALGTMNQRIGEQEHLARQGGESGAFKGVWGRVIGKDYSAGLQSASLGDTESDGRIGGLQLGVDLWRSVAASGARTHVGVFGGQMWSSSNDVSASRIARSLGSTISDGWLVGGYVTHIAASGWYVDAVVQHDGIDHRLSGADGTRALTQSNTTLGSLEVGKAFGSVWKFEPQAQLIYASSRVDSFADSRGTATRIAIDDSLIGRGGFRLKRTWDHDENSDGGLFTIYAKANIWGRLDGGTGMLSVGTSLPGQVRMREAWGDVGIGTTFSLSRAAELFTDFEVEYGIDQGGTALAGRGGLRLRF